MKWLNGYRIRLFLVGFVAVIVLGGGSASADLTWTRKADLPTTRHGLSTSVVNGKIYAIGGWPGIPTVDEYDPGTNTWTNKADMPTPRVELSTSVLGGKIYAIGGTKPASAAVEVYDPATDTWTRKADMPTLRGGLSTSVVEGKIYVIGGMSPGGGDSGNRGSL